MPSSSVPCSMQLRICRDCRFNVVAQYKLALSVGRKAAGHARNSLDGGSRANGGSGKAAVSSGDSASQEAPCHGDGCGCSDGAAASDDSSSAAAGADGAAACCDARAVVPAGPLLPVCEGFSLSITDAAVQLVGSDAAMLLEEAEEIEDLKVSLYISHKKRLSTLLQQFALQQLVCCSSCCFAAVPCEARMNHVMSSWQRAPDSPHCGCIDVQGDDGGEVRHAETPALAQEALIDAVILIFKAQVSLDQQIWCCLDAVI